VTEDFDQTLERAVRGTHFAKAIGAEIVLFKADTIERFIQAGRPFLDRIESTGITPVLQNHYGTAISTLKDFERVIDGINDPRMKTLLEVGHFHSAGVSWQDGYDLLGDSIALVHIKDQIGEQSVPFGTGEIDLPGLFQHMNSIGYRGNYVVEMEVKDKVNTLPYLADAVQYIQQHEPDVHSG
jgi:sugar phosphate isomerase/epimerase